MADRVVGILTVYLHIPGARSLKDRRRAVRSVKDRLRAQFNVAVAEVGPLELWQRADLSVCSVANDRAYVEGLLNKVASFVRLDSKVELLRTESEFV